MRSVLSEIRAELWKMPMLRNSF